MAEWILIGSLLGSLITSTHPNREACEGRAALLREKGAVTKCEEMPKAYSSSLTGVSGGITFGR